MGNEPAGQEPNGPSRSIFTIGSKSNYGAATPRVVYTLADEVVAVVDALMRIPFDLKVNSKPGRQRIIRRRSGHATEF